MSTGNFDELKIHFDWNEKKHRERYFGSIWTNNQFTIQINCVVIWAKRAKWFNNMFHELWHPTNFQVFCKCQMGLFLTCTVHRHTNVYTIHMSVL